MPLWICTLTSVECASHLQNFWKYFNSVSEEPVTRSDFMSVLSNIEYILIKASYGQGLQQRIPWGEKHLSLTSLDTSAWIRCSDKPAVTCLGQTRAETEQIHFVALRGPWRRRFPPSPKAGDACRVLLLAHQAGCLDSWTLIVITPAPCSRYH